jgi:hypothetical protein
VHVAVPPDAAAPFTGPTVYLFRGMWLRDYNRRQREAPGKWLDPRPSSAALVLLPGLPAPAEGSASDEDDLEDALLGAWEAISAALSPLVAPPPDQRLMVGLSDGGRWALLLALVHGEAAALSLHATPGLGRSSWLASGLVTASRVRRLWLHAHVEDPNDAVRWMATLAGRLPSTCLLTRRLGEPGGHAACSEPVGRVLREWVDWLGGRG